MSSGLWRLGPPNGLDSDHWPSILQTILWRLWDARNSEIFRQEHSSITQVRSLRV
ncbi:hypothetical protein BDA96_03G045400 [Sorghum bicolor]|uniref:Uncharacterized protein n=1 Tax=Sorghum bicolor TaxID=4558 RepID=A0A921ULS7_SORBI|nr:hypothetical protein BDA96_03G045400 [Sorghum bicolor]